MPPWPHDRLDVMLGRPAIDLTGKKYGSLIVVERRGSNEAQHALWFCLCDCGQGRIVPGRNLRNGNTKSCGCRRGWNNSETAASLFRTRCRKRNEKIERINQGRIDWQITNKGYVIAQMIPVECEAAVAIGNPRAKNGW